MSTNYINERITRIWKHLKSDDGVTLIEMIVVVLIIGILGAVALRTIDATSYQSKFDKTTKEMMVIVQGIVGNPTVLSEGRRISFGYVGDQGQLPENLGLLINSDGGNWKGPYVARQFVEDTTGFKTDEWGNVYEYNKDNAYIRSTGGGKQQLTMKIADSLSHLFENQVNGVITDINSAPPATYASNILVRLTVPINGVLTNYEIRPRNDGYYEFSPPNYPVPIGYHRIVVYKEYGFRDSLVKFVSVTPHSRVITDFRFALGFHNNLKYVVGSGVAYASVGDTVKNNIGFRVFNSSDTVLIATMVLSSLDTTAYYEQVAWEATPVWICPTPIVNRAGIGEEIVFLPQVLIQPNSVTRFDIKGFKDDEYADPGHAVSMAGRRMVIKFSDGSIIDFTP